MPLSPPAPRRALHTRRIEMIGFERDDGLFDVEAHLVDTKSYPFINHDRGTIEPGVPLHGMLARMTLDRELQIVAFEAATDFAPYSICPQAAPNFARLAGLKIGRGFVKAANERIGGVHGCTHLREMLGQMGTVAFQTMYSIRMRREQAPNAETTAEQAPPHAPPETPPVRSRPANLGTCLAYAPSSPVVQRTWPEHYVPAEAPPPG